VGGITYAYSLPSDLSIASVLQHFRQ